MWDMVNLGVPSFCNIILHLPPRPSPTNTPLPVHLNASICMIMHKNIRRIRICHHIRTYVPSSFLQAGHVRLVRGILSLYAVRLVCGAPKLHKYCCAHTFHGIRAREAPVYSLGSMTKKGAKARKRLVLSGTRGASANSCSFDELTILYGTSSCIAQALLEHVGLNITMTWRYRRKNLTLHRRSCHPPISSYIYIYMLADVDHSEYCERICARSCA